MKSVAPISMPPNFWQERRADDAVVGGRVRPAKGARSCHQNECLRKSAFKVGLLP